MPERQGSGSMDRAHAQSIGKQAQTQSEYALQLYQHVVSLEGVNKNALMSPSSIATALAMTAAGAEGPTLDQFVSHLRHKDAQAMHKFYLYVHNVIFKDGSSVGGPVLGTANGLWVDERTSFNAEFAKYVKAGYGAEAQETDFRLRAAELCKDVNDWVRNRTGGKSTTILSTEALYSYTRLMVVNAFYFKGSWKEKFNPQLTRPRTFHLLDGGTVSVPTMTSSRKHIIKSYSNWASYSDHSSTFSSSREDPWSFDEALKSQRENVSGEFTGETQQPGNKNDVLPTQAPFNFKILKLPYKTAGGKDNRSFSMYILLPDKRDGLPELERDLDASWLMRELPLLTRSEPVGDFFLPKFEVSFNFQVNGALQGLGLTLPFSERKADFAAMLVDDEDSKQDKRQPTGCFCYGLGKKSRPLALSSMVHEAIVEMTEDGGKEAEAIPARVGLTRYNSMEPLYKIDFVADHPFLYIIREDTTEVIVLMGRVANPKQGDTTPLLEI